jgi:transposase-like protein
MPEQRRRFSARFKAEAVQMVIETGKPIASVARDLRWRIEDDLASKPGRKTNADQQMST